jgi:transposase InsO family protein
MRLQVFDFKITFRPGRLNHVPDALSRAIELIEISPDEVSDPKYLDLIKRVNDDPAKFSDFKISNGLLYKFISADDPEDPNFQWKIVVPQNLIPKVLQESHDERSHLGYFKTLKTIKTRYYWRYMNRDIKKYVNQCARCKASKTPTHITRPPMGSQKIAPYPWHTISMDLMERLPRSKKGFSSLLVVTDWFTKMVLMTPVRSTGAQAICKFVEDQVFLLFGVPKYVITDNGKAFISRQFKNLLSEYQVLHRLNPAHHPQHNPTERVNKVIGASLRAVLGDDQREWDTHIPKIAASIRSAVHVSTKFSPYFVNFGKEMKWSGREHESMSDENVENEDMSVLVQRLDRIRRIVSDNISKAYESYSKHYNLRTRQISYEVGQTVWKKRYRQSKAIDRYNAKLDDLYEPVTIIKRTGNIYEVRNANGKNLGTVHAKDLKA